MHDLPDSQRICSCVHVQRLHRCGRLCWTLLRGGRLVTLRTHWDGLHDKRCDFHSVSPAAKSCMRVQLRSHDRLHIGAVSDREHGSHVFHVRAKASNPHPAGCPVTSTAASQAVSIAGVHCAEYVPWQDADILLDIHGHPPAHSLHISQQQGQLRLQGECPLREGRIDILPGMVKGLPGGGQPI